MRLGFVLYGNLGMLSGGFLYDRILVEHCRRRGHAVEEFSLPWRPYGWGLAHNFSPVLTRRLADAPWNLMLQDELAHPSLFRLNRRLRRRGAPPLVAVVHHLRCREERPAWQNLLYRLVERRYLASVDGFIFNSMDTRRSVEALLPAPKPFVVAPPGGDRFASYPDEAEIAARTRAAASLRLLFLANVMPRKGLHALVRALAALSHEKWELEVVGSLTVEPGYTRAVRRQVEAAGLAGRVHFRGPRYGCDVAACLASSHLLTVPSSLEGFGIVYLEAMGFGLPVIASRHGGARELVVHGENGFLVAPGDLEALITHLDLLLKDRQKLLDMSLASRRHFARHPTWAESAGRAVRFLEQFPQAP